MAHCQVSVLGPNKPRKGSKSASEMTSHLAWLGIAPLDWTVAPHTRRYPDGRPESIRRRTTARQVDLTCGPQAIIIEEDAGRLTAGARAGAGAGGRDPRPPLRRSDPRYYSRHRA